MRDNGNHLQWGRKLTWQQRDEIKRRLEEGEAPKDLALEFGISVSTVRSYR